MNSIDRETFDKAKLLLRTNSRAEVAKKTGLGKTSVSRIANNRSYAQFKNSRKIIVVTDSMQFEQVGEKQPKRLWEFWK